MDRNKIYKMIKDLLPYVLIIVVVIIVKQYFFTTILVNGDSMNNTLRENDIMILDKFSYRVKAIKRFDIVVVQTTNTKLIKRVIGLPGEHLKYEDNQLYINDKKLEDIYGTGITYDFDLKNISLNKIPEDYYFVLGDNREDSIDSRVIGVVHKDKILGHATLRLYPFNRIGLVD